MNIKTANRLIELRKKHGYSQEELANELRLSRQTISKWERSEASPDTDNLIALANLYGMSLDELLGINEEKYDAEDLSSSAEIIDAEVKEEAKGKEETEIHATENDTHNENTYTSMNGVSTMDMDEDLDGEDVNIFANTPYESQFRAFVKSTDKWRRQRHIVSIIRTISFVAALVAFLLIGFLVPDGWRWSWTLLLTFDILPSLLNAIFNKKFCSFNILMTILFIYLLFGMLIGAWHPNWALFFIIPVYYSLFAYIDGLIWVKRIKKWTKENIINGEIEID